jgi:putative redox protein
MPTSQTKPPSVVNVVWNGEQRFDVNRTGRPSSRVDAAGATGPGPVDTLLGALGACASVDALEILAKRRTPVERLSVVVTGDRAQTVPARVVRIQLEFQIDGAGIDRTDAERAVKLSITKYCSVRSSLDPAIPVLYTVTLNGEKGGEIG